MSEIHKFDFVSRCDKIVVDESKISRYKHAVIQNDNK